MKRKSCRAESLLGGRAPSVLLAVSIDTTKGQVIITDSFFKYGNIEQGHYLGVMESMMEADATWARIRKEADIIASIYDPEVFVRHPGGVLA